MRILRKPKGEIESSPQPVTSARREWRLVPSLQRVSRSALVVSAPELFISRLSTTRSPQVLAPLGHYVSSGAPSGVVHDSTTRAMRPSRTFKLPEFGGSTLLDAPQVPMSVESSIPQYPGSGVGEGTAFTAAALEVHQQGGQEADSSSPVHPAASSDDVASGLLGKSDPGESGAGWDHVASLQAMPTVPTQDVALQASTPGSHGKEFGSQPKRRPGLGVPTRRSSDESHPRGNRPGVGSRDAGMKRLALQRLPEDEAISPSTQNWLPAAPAPRQQMEVSAPDEPADVTQRGDPQKTGPIEDFLSMVVAPQTPDAHVLRSLAGRQAKPTTVQLALQGSDESPEATGPTKEKAKPLVAPRQFAGHPPLSGNQDPIGRFEKSDATSAMAQGPKDSADDAQALERRTPILPSESIGPVLRMVLAGDRYPPKAHEPLLPIDTKISTSTSAGSVSASAGPSRSPIAKELCVEGSAGPVLRTVSAGARQPRRANVPMLSIDAKVSRLTSASSAVTSVASSPSSSSKELHEEGYAGLQGYSSAASRFAGGIGTIPTLASIRGTLPFGGQRVSEQRPELFSRQPESIGSERSDSRPLPASAPLRSSLVQLPNVSTEFGTLNRSTQDSGWVRSSNGVGAEGSNDAAVSVGLMPVQRQSGHEGVSASEHEDVSRLTPTPVVVSQSNLPDSPADLIGTPSRMAPQSPADLDELAERLYGRIRIHLRDELRLDRERSGKHLSSWR